MNTLSGLIEHRGRIIAARVPVALMVMDAQSFALTRIEQLRLEALDPDFTSDERVRQIKRADALDRWVKSGCCGPVTFDVDVTLYARSIFDPAVIMRNDLDTYLEAILNVSSVVSIESLAPPAFAIRNNGEPELWLTDHPALRAPRLHPGPEIKVVETFVLS